MIRFIITALFVVLFLILSIPLLIAEWIVGKISPAARDKSSLAIVNWAFRMVLRLSGVSVTYLGEERVPKDMPVLYVGNHRSYFDIVLTYVRVPRTTGYIAKKEFLKIPLLSAWMKNLHCLFLDRSDVKEGLKTILAAIDEMKKGVSICIFPEGTRNKTDAPLLPFHAGSLKIAEKSKCPIVPMAITNAAEIFENHLPKIKKARVIVEYGEPIYTDHLDREAKKALTDTVVQRISEMYEKNKKEV
ncbi:MAG: lysophospholipid acyltransferase family protein [Eubacteriales bacterium]|nr:lysophospholipid acyltransferase family protein [Eubacteriales bacterium]